MLFKFSLSQRFLFIIVCAFLPLTSSASDKTVIGWVENIAIGKTQTLFVAKIDTGAENSSLHARDIKLFKSRGMPWVSFRVKNKFGKVYRFKKKIKRMATIKRKSAPDQVRPVVDLELCLGNIHKTVEVNLVDRGNFKYAFLVGKSYLSGAFIVDVEKSFSIEPACSKAPLKKNLAP